jgi:hypothetical protein
MLSASRSVIFFIASLGVVASFPVGAAPKNLELIDVTTNSSGDELNRARAAFSDGEAIVRMIGSSPQEFSRTLGVHLGEIKASSYVSKTRNITQDSPGTLLKLQAAAAYIDANKVLRSVLVFAPESASDADSAHWQKELTDWITARQLDPAGDLLGDPTPPTEAWTLLYTTTILTDDGVVAAQNTLGFYRLNTTSLASDYEVHPWGETRS